MKRLQMQRKWMNLRQRLRLRQKKSGMREIRKSLTTYLPFTVIFPVCLRRRSLDTAAKPTRDAAISVTVKWEDDTETTISFTAYDSSFHLAEINGEARKLVNKRDVEKLVEDMTALLKK
ncbi:MAG: hypothetical protein ACLS2X_05925 [Coprococcus sp.]